MTTNAAIATPRRPPSASKTTDLASVLIDGKDKPGIVAAVTRVLAEHGGNIVSLDQYSDDPEGGAFFQRTIVQVDSLRARIDDLGQSMRDRLGEEFDLRVRVRDLSVPLRMVVFASKSDHCLLDLLWKHRRGELPVSIPMVISNHADVAADVHSFGIPFFHVPSQGADKSAAEAEILALVRGNADFLVLARYMQIISGDFLRDAEVPVINIHHSFLPAFIGAAPYARAKERGVKLIGATAHYVTEDLDEGPIIEQGVARVTHAHSAADLQRRGAEVERAVLSRAVQWHAEDRVIRAGGHTIVFP